MFWFVPAGTFTHNRDLRTFELVDEEKLIHINQAKITAAEGNSITLDTSATIDTDAIVWCIGWMQSNFTLCSSALANELGLPIVNEELPKQEAEYWKTLDNEASKRITDLYAILNSPPANIPLCEFPITPFRLSASSCPQNSLRRATTPWY